MKSKSKGGVQSVDSFVTKNLHKLVRDLLSEKYHSLSGTWSSSQFKDIIEDEDVFIRKYITKEIPREEREVFDTGTYLHTSLLEPHKVKDEIAIFPGKIRRGKEWEKFRSINSNKMVITLSQKEEGDSMIKAVRNSPIACSYLKGEPEVSLFTQLVVENGVIYAPKYKRYLTIEGWREYTRNIKLDDGYSVIVKVRADTLGDDFISDLKSTSSNSRHEHSVRNSISKYRYDLSAALYLDMFSLIRPSVREFIWIFASKTANNCTTWRASNENILVGRAKYIKALVKLADCARSNWESVDCLREADPLPHELEWIRQKDTDLI